jgi:hypothetical protein
LRLKPIDIPSPPRSSRARQLWGAEDTPGYDEGGDEEDEDAPLIQLPVDPGQLPPGVGPEDNSGGPPPAIAPGPARLPPAAPDDQDDREPVTAPEDTQ